ncbi:PfkB family carbohydrate kinase [Sediminispirochaeta bajacaliforniensis]|uniref:PfkB family carbohydrate kinase n=1 Tax=Sediminispirochaeta bajacaliforniensis TaxID=148 RepID=UPI00036EB10B|nr:PfkB family carbohydrate kinase [Sediminispirochaeta bajacaliforniensis]
MLRVLGLGDNVVDKYRTDRIMYPGGNALNFSVYAKHLHCHSAYMGVIGDDLPAWHIFSVLRELDIDISRTRVEAGENGFAEVEIRNGDRVFVGSNKGGVAKTHPIILNYIDDQYIKTFDLIHTSCFSYLDDFLPHISSLNPYLSYDFSTSFTAERCEKVCPYIFSAALSCSHLPDDEIDELITSIQKFGCKIIIASKGMRGVSVAVGDLRINQNAIPIHIVDSMGAGDSLLTAFLVHSLEILKRRADGKHPEDMEESKIRLALAAAVVFATQNCMKHGSFGYGCQY